MFEFFTSAFGRRMLTCISETFGPTWIRSGLLPAAVLKCSTRASTCDSTGGMPDVSLELSLDILATTIHECLRSSHSQSCFKAAACCSILKCVRV